MNFATYTRWKDNRFHGVADTPTIAPPGAVINPGLTPKEAHRLEKATAGCAAGSSRWCDIKARLSPAPPPAPAPKTCVDNCTGETYSTIGDCGVKTCTPPAATPPPTTYPTTPPPTQPVPGGGDFLCTMLGICSKPTDQPQGPPAATPGSTAPSDSTGQLLDTFMKLFGGQVSPGASPPPSSEGSVVTVPAQPAPVGGGSNRGLVIFAVIIALGLGGYWLYKKMRKKG